MPGPGDTLPDEGIDTLLVHLRQSRGFSQLRLAEALCAASGTPTVSRHEISRWERGERVPGPHWLGWLAAVLEVAPQRLARGVAVTRWLRTRPEPPPRWTWIAPGVLKLGRADERLTMNG